VVRLQGFEEFGVEANQVKVKTLALSVAAVALVEAGLAFSMAAFRPVFRLGVARLLELGLMAWIVHTVEGSNTFLGLDRWQWSAGLKKGLLWSAGFGAFSGIVFAILHVAGINPLSLIRTSLPRDSANLFLFFLVGGIVAPVAEEVFFRGILYGFLRRWGVWVAVVFSTCAFALAHGLGHGFLMTQVVGGILFAVAYEAEKNLLVPITIHCLGNMAIFALSALL
jgi:membrane protease YdiL (CAAX protease family)